MPVERPEYVCWVDAALPLNVIAYGGMPPETFKFTTPLASPLHNTAVMIGVLVGGTLSVTTTSLVVIIQVWLSVIVNVYVPAVVVK